MSVVQEDVREEIRAEASKAASARAKKVIEKPSGLFKDLQLKNMRIRRKELIRKAKEHEHKMKEYQHKMNDALDDARALADCILDFDD